MHWYSLPNQTFYNCLLALYKQQTISEQIAGRTFIQNGKGFNAIDAPVMSLYARMLKQNGSLSNAAMLQVKKRLWKYRHQLVELGVLNDYVFNRPAIRESVVEQLSLSLEY